MLSACVCAHLTHSAPNFAGVYVHSINTGDGAMADVSSSFFGNVNDQVWF